MPGCFCLSMVIELCAPLFGKSLCYCDGNAGDKEIGVGAAKDGKTSRTMFFQGGVYVTSPTGTSFTFTII